eukprot:scaffold658611_cov38-Prasinocladus_malaysianus.AAC.1
MTAAPIQEPLLTMKKIPRPVLAFDRLHAICLEVSLPWLTIMSPSRGRGNEANPRRSAAHHYYHTIPLEYNVKEVMGATIKFVVLDTDVPT